MCIFNPWNEIFEQSKKPNVLNNIIRCKLLFHLSSALYLYLRVEWKASINIQNQHRALDITYHCSEDPEIDDLL